MTSNINDWLNEHGDYLYRFALARLKDPHQAEDAVQETMLAAIKNNSFAGDSSARTWLTGILKHKIIDLQRKQMREQPVSDLMNLDESESSMDDFFDSTGHSIFQISAGFFIYAVYHNQYITHWQNTWIWYIPH